MMEHHGDGEELPVTDLEILRVSLPRDCGHCGGLLLLDADDPGHSKCSECCRSSYRPASEVLADAGQGKPSCSESHIHGRSHAVQGKGREPSIPVGIVHPNIRRFA